MSLFSWFSVKPTAASQPLAGKGAHRARAPKRHEQAAPAPAIAKPAGTPGERPSANAVGVERKVKRQVRREQLYTAIRESMTRAGMLSASYKFKVLSLDQNGNQFLVMMDVAPELDTGPQKLSQTEALLIQTAKAAHGITVTAVYWRTDRKAVANAVQPPLATATAATRPAFTEQDAFAQTQSPPLEVGAASASTEASASTSANAPAAAKSGQEALLQAEVAAFKRALAAPAAAPPHAALRAAHEADKADRADKSNKSDKSERGRTGLRSYALITGFEDTEMPESTAMPALSNTQYGELR